MTAPRGVVVRRASGCLAALVALALTGCGASRPLALSVVSQDQDPVSNVSVAVYGTSVLVATDQQGKAALKGLRPGLYRITASAPGYYVDRTIVRMTTRGPATIMLRYRPPLGTFVFDIGPDGLYWEEATVTPSAVTATEFDWTCRRDTRTRKEVGAWARFPTSAPGAIAPATLGAAWSRRRFPASGPPPPPSGCGGSTEHSRSPIEAPRGSHVPWWA